MKNILLTTIVLASLILSCHANKKCAVVTMITGNDEGYIMGAIALGNSLKKHNTQMEMLCLTYRIGGGEVGKSDLKRSGWELREVELIKHPDPNDKSRFVHVFTKLHIFELTEYDRVVYLDSDTIVNTNIDELCNCNSRYCAVVRNTFFNAGVMTITPSQEVFDDMVYRYTKIPAKLMPGDQDFLNMYFWNPERCKFYEPLIDIDDTDYLSCRRLPSYYNGDVAIYSFRGNNWMYNPETRTENEQPKITHFTFGSIKPWDWWSYLFITEHWKWWDAYTDTSHFFSYIPWVAYKLMVICCLIFVPLPSYSVHWRLFTFQIVNLCSFMFALGFSSILTVSPYYDVFTFIFTYCILIDYVFKWFCVPSFLLSRIRIYFYPLFSLVYFYLLFLDSTSTLFVRIAILAVCTIIGNIIFPTFIISQPFAPSLSLP